MFNGSNCDQKSQLSGILTEPLNPREVLPCQTADPSQSSTISAREEGGG